MTTNSGQQNVQQNSQTSPWKPAQPALQSILGNIQGLEGISGINPTEQAAIQQLTQNAGQIPNFTGQAAGQTGAFIGGDPFNILNPAYQQYRNSLQPLTNPANLNPMNTPGFSDALKALNADITQQVNGEFAGAGRSGSGYNTQTLTRGLSQGEGGLIANQYNQNAQNLINAGNSLFTGGLGASNALGGNTAQGFNFATALPGVSAAGPGSLLTAGQTPFNLLAGNQGAIAGLTVPIAGLGGQSVGQSQTNTSFTPSLESALLAPFQGGSNSGASGAARAGLGILGMFA